MSLGVGQREYHPFEEKEKSPLRSLSATRAHLILWRRQHPLARKELAWQEALIDSKQAKIRSYNESLYDLRNRAGSKPPVHLSGAIARLESLRQQATQEFNLQLKERNEFAGRIYDWENKLPQLDAEIAKLRSR